MAEYKSNYTGLEIDEAIAKAITASQTDKHLESVTVYSEEGHEVEVEKTSYVGNKTTAASYAGGSIAGQCWWLTNIPEYKAVIGKKLNAITFSTNTTGTIRLYGYTEEIDCRASSGTTEVASRADTNKTLLITITVSETGEKTYKLDGTDSRVVIADGSNEVIAPATLGVERNITAKILYNNSSNPVTTTDTTIISGFQQASGAVPAVSPGKYQSFIFDFDYIGTEYIPGEQVIRHTMNDDTNLDLSVNDIIVDGSIAEDKLSYELREKINTKTENQPLKGLKWNVLGDSITHLNHLNVAPKYYEIISENQGGMTLGYYGVSGTRICGTASNAMCNRYTQMTDGVDIVTVFGGVNDWGQTNPSPLGEYGDTENTTFYGGLDILCRGLQTKYPEATIMFITPLGQTGFSTFPVSGLEANALGFTINDYVEAIKKVCGKYAIPVVDLFTEAGFTHLNSIQRTKYFVDGLHPNAAGHKKMSAPIQSKLLDMVSK